MEKGKRVLARLTLMLPKIIYSFRQQIQIIEMS